MRRPARSEAGDTDPPGHPVKLIRANQRTTGVGVRLDALSRVVDAAEGRVPESALDQAREVLRRAADRFGMSAEHTLAVFGGATGVGKSSLFNALVGIGLSPVAVRRPTTTSALACVWEADRLAEARPLLDRIGVEGRRQLTRDSALDRSAVRDPLAGLVLVDLPDHDSAVREHRSQVDHAVALADVLIWVTDPQKYADASWHDRYLKALAHHADVMLIVLNQIDRLPAESVRECVADLARLVEEDGLPAAVILPVSVRTGQGLAELRRELAGRVAGRRAAAERLAADVDRVAERLAPLLLGPGADQIVTFDPQDVVSEQIRAETLSGLRGAAGVASLADAVGQRVAARTSAAVATPLRELFRRRVQAGAVGTPGARQLRDLVRLATEGLSAAPAPVPVDRGALETVLGRLSDTVTHDLPTQWARVARDQVMAARRDLADRIDIALAACELDAIPPARRIAIQTLHGLFLAAAVAGVALAFVRSLPWWAGPGLIVGGLLATTLTGAVAGFLARRSAWAVGQVAVGQLSVELSAVAQDTLFDSIATELTRYHAALTDFAQL
jgi:GTP-binding protein EngB required for normal cell division